MELAASPPMALMNLTSCSKTNCRAPWSALAALASSSKACIFSGYLFPPTRRPPVLFTASIQIVFPVTPGSPHPASGPDSAQRKPTLIVFPMGYFLPIFWSGRWLKITISSSDSPAGPDTATDGAAKTAADAGPAIPKNFKKSLLPISPFLNFLYCSSSLSGLSCRSCFILYLLSL